ncbi:hypothetical protein PS900_00671 [Pseudomonas fluorescens]|uniref:HTH luxR-type domain-containing protein n=1 Tax=Pseudomonas fluorescens TaxID=294 RepID=A0A8H2NMQ0_PSEFL|nr:helix-turn-helix transcriptional regulator [Pseudomonas fluorescens]VVO58455.1 hypothetical protein PS900_00671 [Pseudomonas fluorescens]
MLNSHEQDAASYTSPPAIMSDTISISTAAAPSRLGVLIDAVGEREFEVELLSLLHETSGAEHCTVFCLDDDVPRGFGAVSLDGSNTARANATRYLQRQFWRRDPTMEVARQQTRLTHMSLIRRRIRSIEDPELREQIYAQMGERLLICGPSAAGGIALSMLKPGHDAMFDAAGVLEMQRLASLLLPIVGKHISASWQRRNILLALTSITEIEDCIAQAAQKFPSRERQVCSRIIYGMFTTGIALELGISEETVTTYRKRLYQRLGIATQRELLIWYVTQWTSGEVASTSLRHSLSWELESMAPSLSTGTVSGRH